MSFAIAMPVVLAPERLQREDRAEHLLGRRSRSSGPTPSNTVGLVVGAAGALVELGVGRAAQQHACAVRDRPPHEAVHALQVARGR